jgi:hypothetical protein
MTIFFTQYTEIASAYLLVKPNTVGLGNLVTYDG